MKFFSPSQAHTLAGHSDNRTDQNQPMSVTALTLTKEKMKNHWLQHYV